ncbi:MAG: 30S ribosomal protein S12 methylthiotransferase RimO [Bacteroidaceae bacterium]|nr:30S ribosomal protein S12 methylthiotransferase RimO [Bacteroidaceae bacterium]
MTMKRVDFVTLGCSKNLVDSERLIAMLEAGGYAVEHDPETCEGDIAVVNTCGFIGDAKEESINTILEFAQTKTEGRLERLYVMGCLSQRYLEELKGEIPEVDRWFGKFDYADLLDELGKLRNEEDTRRHLTTPRHYAYLKISEGCDRHCGYCAIPIITGRHVSRPMEEILDEVRWLVEQGVTEIQVIAQELTYYGIDLYKKRCIAELIDRMADIEGVRWIRLHYAYPTDFPMELLDVMARRENVCKYIDIALQHISTNVLRNMRRNIDSTKTRELITAMREKVPGIHLRTTMMVGYPGETDADFDELMAFVREARFERLGAFAYSEEEGTYSAERLTDDVPDDVKQARLGKLMRVQQAISAEIQAEKVGREMEIVIDREEGDYYVGRTEFDSPEVDPEVLVERKTPGIEIGKHYRAIVTGAEEFDLYAKILRT